jgi:hypothetical protein
MEETVALSPFIISTERDVGWSANDTLSATRTKQALKDVPVNIDAITADFIEDLGLFSVDEIANFVAGAYAPPTMENDSQSGAIAFRGLQRLGGHAKLLPLVCAVRHLQRGASRLWQGLELADLRRRRTRRSGFRVHEACADAEFRGVLFRSTTTRARIRFQVDYNRKVTNNLAFRLNAVKRQERTYQDASTFGLEGWTLTTTWRPLRNTMVRLEYERGDFANVRGFGGLGVGERSGRSRAYTNDRLYYTSDGEYIIRAQLPAADRSNAADGGSPSLLEGGYFRRADAQRRRYGRGHEALLRFPEALQHPRLVRSAGAAVLGVLRHHRAARRAGRPRVRLQPPAADGEADGQFLQQCHQPRHQGRPYVETELDEKNFGNEVNAARGTAVYLFDKFKWMQQLLVLSADFREDWVKNYRFNYFNVAAIDNGTATTFNANTDRIRLRLFLDDPRFYSRALFDAMRPRRCRSRARFT